MTGKDAPDRPGDGYDARPYLPRGGGLEAHRRASASCQGCPLFAEATATVFGRGDPAARFLVVGEQPGDQEDRKGQAFVGPAGRLLSKALSEAGIDEEDVYLTNAVKHFKFTQSGPGKRRIHKAPSLREMTACRPWLEAELRLVDPSVVVVLGATAGKAVLGRGFRVGADRGAVLSLPGTDGGPHVVATLHPSAVLRADDRESAYAGLVADLRVAADAL
ncbi:MULTISPECIES: UdgX family uracil-DNA binding protein [Streptomyces]|uniref:UdgX family uracil-DNA binding protein n=1 Tax=Streptomyces TaxID=1883 RepID=UPI001318B64F|nr:MULTISPECIES: UdgX family uracil-DNA binding protein [Streptomyces]QGZ52110.1 UdgX family uracil-DNA binding protein [Streptomyces sp. QHH-9511]GGT73322.1 uracil-DNA glycosylase [Streptomyces lateritius]